MFPLLSIAIVVCLHKQTMTDSQKRYETERHALFFKEEACKKLYKDHIEFMVNRVNSYTGKKYKNDPTILAWNLINEPRCETWIPANSWCPETLASWFKVGGWMQQPAIWQAVRVGRCA